MYNNEYSLLHRMYGGHENPYSYYNRSPISCISENEVGLMKQMRMAWSQHVYWTRLLLISIAEDLKDLDATTKRLLQNPNDIANLFRPYYGDTAANTISNLLTEHLIIGADLIKALKKNNKVAAEDLNRRWYINADKMAEAFSSINPYFDKETLRKMLYLHLDLTKEEVSNRLSGNYPEDIKVFDKVEQEALMMADYFVNGIVLQFPNRF